MTDTTTDVSTDTVTRTRMPSVYIPHGGGPAFFMTGPMADTFVTMREFLAGLDSLLPATPSALLVVTAHWEEPVTTITAGDSPPLIFDYYGFPDETYALTYPAPASPGLARRAADLLEGAGIAQRLDEHHGWDHGVFIPLMVMYPDADIPVVAVSLRSDLDAAAQVAVGRALAPLRDDGVLIVGSGMSFHNLRRFMADSADGIADSIEFDRWLTESLGRPADDRARALSAWAGAPGARSSHPREEHLLPLMVASGAGGDAPARKVYADTVGGHPVSGWLFD